MLRKKITCNPSISSIDWSVSTVLEEPFDVWGIGSLIVVMKQSRKQHNHYQKLCTIHPSANKMKSPIVLLTLQGFC